MSNNIIQWFPGHMHKTEIELKKLIHKVDVILELRDARIPYSSSNPLLNFFPKTKTIVVLNKNDIADNNLTMMWLNYYAKQGKKLVSYSVKTNRKQGLLNLCREIAPNRNSFHKPLRIMLSGIPNVGKSSLINQLALKKIAKVADVPATTINLNQIIIDKDCILYDTPGILWHNLTTEETGIKLALCNSIGVNAYHSNNIVLFLLNYMKDNYANRLIMRYNLTLTQLALEVTDLLLAIGNNLNLKTKNNIIDLKRTSDLIINDFRSNKFKNITLEAPHE